MTEEKALIQQVLDGNTEAFSELVTLYEKQIYNYCLRMVSNPEDARDLTQEAFVKAWQGLQFYRAESSFSTWLYRLTANVCIDFLRQQKRRPTVSLTVEEDGETMDLDIPSDEPSTEEVVLHRADRAAVAEAMAQLEEEFRQVLTLRVVDELTYDEIGSIANLKPGTVKSRIARARSKLQKILLQNGNNVGGKTSNHTEGGKQRDL